LHAGFEQHGDDRDDHLMVGVDDLLATIADPETEESDLLDAIGRLGADGEPASFWRQIADDGRYRDSHRAYAIFELLRRHGAAGMTLGQLAELLGGASWLRDDGLDVIDVLAGELPVTWNPGDTVFVLHVVPGSPEFAVYLRAEGKRDAAAAMHLLRTGEADEATRAARVLEIGFASPRGAPPTLRVDSGGPA